MAQLKEFRAGDVLSAADLNRLIALAERVAKLEVQPPLLLSDSGDGFLLSVVLPSGGWIKITSGGTGGKYAWTAQDGKTGGTWAAALGNASGTTSTNPAYEVNGFTNVPANKYVWAWLDKPSNEIRFHGGECP